MPNTKTINNHVTKEVLKKELTAVEKRLDAKIDSTAQSFKEYVDSKLVPVNTKLNSLDTKLNSLDAKFTARFGKMERYFEELVGMFVRRDKKIDRALDRIENHDQRITVLESK